MEIKEISGCWTQSPMINSKEHWWPQVHQKHTFLQIHKYKYNDKKCTKDKYKNTNTQVQMNSREYWRPQVHQRHSEETISLFPSLPSAPLSHAFSSYIHTLTLLNCIFSMCIVHTLYWETHQMHTYFMHTQSYTFSAFCIWISEHTLKRPSHLQQVRDQSGIDH